MNTEYTIQTRKGPRRVSRKKAILHAARCVGYHPSGIARLFTAPRGQKGSAVELAKRAQTVMQYRRMRFSDPLSWSLSVRLAARKTRDKLRIESILVNRGLAEIEKRGLSTPTGFGDHPVHVMDHDAKADLFLIHTSYWHKYSARQTWPVNASYFCGSDDGHDFAVRVPGRITKIANAIHWLEPAAVRKKEAQGQPVYRQGDIWFVPVRKAMHDTMELGSTRHKEHVREDGGLSITHPEHKTLELPGGQAWKAYRSNHLAAEGSGD